MRAKIQKSMLLLICAAVISSFVMLEIVFYAYALNQMKKDGVIHREGPDKGGSWIVN